MSVNFNSNVSVGQTGSLDTRMQLLEQRHKKDELWLGGSSSLFGYCETQGIRTDRVLNRIENNMGYENGSLSWGRSVTDYDNPNAVLFQDAFGSFAELNTNKGTFEIKSEKQVTSAFCDWSQGRPYDAYTLDQGGFSFYQFFASGLGDGQLDSIYLDRFKNPLFKWGLTRIIQQEINA